MKQPEPIDRIRAEEVLAGVVELRRQPPSPGLDADGMGQGSRRGQARRISHSVGRESMQSGRIVREPSRLARGHWFAPRGECFPHPAPGAVQSAPRLVAAHKPDAQGRDFTAFPSLARRACVQRYDQGRSTGPRGTSGSLLPRGPRNPIGIERTISWPREPPGISSHTEVAAWQCECARAPRKLRCARALARRMWCAAWLRIAAIFHTAGLTTIHSRVEARGKVEPRCSIVIRSSFFSPQCRANSTVSEQRKSWPGSKCVAVRPSQNGCGRPGPRASPGPSPEMSNFHGSD